MHKDDLLGLGSSLPTILVVYMLVVEVVDVVENEVTICAILTN